MSQVVLARQRSRSTKSHSSRGSRGEQASRSGHSSNHPDIVFDACAATASFFLYSQRNIISCLHHDTLAIERRFDKHREDVLLISADNVSERGAGRLIVSYDAGQMAIVWDLFTGDEIARFASYEHIRVAAWMKDGSVAFGNDQGNIILFEPPTSEHISARTIFDPVTALAPLPDCRTFAIGYQNGSILVATLQPTFNILHTLTTSRPPSPITGLAWHGSSSKQKTDMLATQTSDGDLRVWSVSKVPHAEAPRIIRILSAGDTSNEDKTWFAWSKNGRIVQHRGSETRAWDVRTKNMTSTAIPVVDNVCAIANYGPGATLFTVGSNYTVQQYDVNSTGGPTMVANVQHIPSNAPPTPPDSVENHKFGRSLPNSITPDPPAMPISTDGETTDEEGPILSPIQKIAKEMDDLEAERRDQLAPLSPVSSRASLSSASSYGRPRRMRKGTLSRTSSDHTTFSDGSSMLLGGRESVSIRSSSSIASAGDMPSVRQRMMRQPNEGAQSKSMELFAYAKARLSEVKFRTPQYPSNTLTPDVLRREMISVVFGWDHDIEALIRDEQSRQPPGAASSVLLSRWLGDISADTMAERIGSESMTSSDWMLLALSCSMGGQGSQKKVSETFVRRLLETGEVHPAVAILLGLGEQNEAVEVYVSRKCYFEAVLLTCLCFPSDWKRQSFLVRKWGEMAVSNGQAELAVRCFSCTTIEPTENWFSPRAQDAVYQAQQQILAPDSAGIPHSPPSAGGSNRMKHASLKLITSFGDNGAAKPQQTNLGVTPILETATTPINKDSWHRSSSRGMRDDSRTRTATPGGVHRQKFPPSRPGSRQADIDNTPLPETAIEVGPAAPSLFVERRAASRAGSSSHGQGDSQPALAAAPVVEMAEVVSPGVGSNASYRSRTRRSRSSQARRDDSPSRTSTTSASQKSFKGRNIDRYIDSLEEANNWANQQRSESQTRGESRESRSRSRARARDLSVGRGRSEARYIPPAKRSPSSPKALSSEDASKYRSGEQKYEPTPASPMGSVGSAAYRTSQAVSMRSGVQSEYATSVDGRGRTRSQVDPGNRSPSSPSPMQADDLEHDRARSRSARPSQSGARVRSTSRRQRQEPEPAYEPDNIAAMDFADRDRQTRPLTRKELAQKELEERRLSLARRPSAPAIPQPSSDFPAITRPSMSPRSITDSDYLPSRAYEPIQRSHTVDPDAMSRHQLKTSGTATTSVPIGLPATPRAMRHPRYTSSDPNDGANIPAVPAVPSNAETLAPISYNPNETEDEVGPLLPTTVYGQRGPIQRAATAPPEKYMGALPGLPSRPNSRATTAASRPESMSSRMTNGSRRTSTSEAQNSLRSASGQIEIVHDPQRPGDDQVIVVDDAALLPPVLAELQHLNGPPPPPPPPTLFSQHASHSHAHGHGHAHGHAHAAQPGASGVIDIGIDGASAATHSTQAAHDVGMAPMPLTAANLHRRSQTEAAAAATAAAGSTSRWRQYADRMRSTSKSRTKSPPLEQGARFGANASPAPYETFLPAATFARTRSPAGASDAAVSSSDAGTAPSGPTPSATPLSGAGAEVERFRSGSTSGYRNPKEIRANMPPQELQLGVNSIEGGMI